MLVGFVGERETRKPKKKGKGRWLKENEVEKGETNNSENPGISQQNIGEMRKTDGRLWAKAREGKIVMKK